MKVRLLGGNCVWMVHASPDTARLQSLAPAYTYIYILKIKIKFLMIDRQFFFRLSEKYQRIYSLLS